MSDRPVKRCAPRVDIRLMQMAGHEGMVGLLQQVWSVLDADTIRSEKDVLFDVLDLLRIRLDTTAVRLTMPRPAPLPPRTLTTSDSSRTASDWDASHQDPLSIGNSGAPATSIVASSSDGAPNISSSDRIALELISSRIDDWLAKREARRQVAESQALSSSLIGIHEQLVSAPDDRLIATITDSLERLVVFAEAEYAALTRVAAADLTMTPVAFWSPDGRIPEAAPIDRSLFELLESMEDLVEVTGAALANGFRMRGVSGTGTMLTGAVKTTRGLAEHQLSIVRAEVSPWTDSQRLFVRMLAGHLGQALSRISSQQLFRLAFDSAPTGLTIRNQQLELVACNHAYEEFVRSSEAELIGTKPETVGAADQVVGPVGQTEEQELQYNFADGHSGWASLRQTSIQTVDGGALYLSHVQDITERKRVESKLVHQATHDALTGLGNRRLLSRRLDDLFSAGTACGIVMLDLDRFKVVNDSLGHDAGDELLLTIADRLRTVVRPTDVVARLGGDEFAILMSGEVSEFETAALAERLLAVIAKPVQLSGQRVFPEASIGVAVSAGHALDPDTLIRQADTAMYEAKDAGRNRTSMFTPDMDERVQHRLRLDDELRSAIEKDEFVLHYQPEINLMSGSTIGAEALIRWQHPHGLRMPDSFIGRAEESGRIVEIGEWVLGSACQQMALWRKSDDAPDQVRVNLSAVQLVLASIVDDVGSAMEAAHIEPRHLCLEITESALMDDVELSLHQLTKLKDLGITLAIDDFGTGFSSLSYLQQFPVDVLKVDRSFVGRLSPEQPSSIALVESIINLAHAFDLDIVAEGIETEEQAAILVDLGCQRGQGFLYSKAVPASDLALNGVGAEKGL